MEETVSAKILRDHGLKATTQRLIVLALFATDNKALTHREIRRELGNKIDRVSVYRIINLLTEHKILLCMADHTGYESYIINQYNSVEEEIVPLVKCEKCNCVSLLPRMPSVYEQILKKNHLSKQPVFHGICEGCQK